MIITTENATQIGGINCWDQETEEIFDRYETVATRKIVCAWTDRAALIRAMNPGAISVGDFAVFDALPYPEFPSLFPQRFRTKGKGKISVGASGLIAYEYAEVTAEYKTFNAGDVEIDTGANVITLPRTGPCLESDEGAPITLNPQDTPGKPIAVINIVQGRNNVPSLPMSAIRSIATNPLNSQPFLGYDPGTVMFEGGRARKINTTNIGTGVVGNNSLLGPFDIEYRFTARPEIPWDNLPFRDPTTGEFSFKKVRFKNNGGPFLGRSSFDVLFS